MSRGGGVGSVLAVALAVARRRGTAVALAVARLVGAVALAVARAVALVVARRLVGAVALAVLTLVVVVALRVVVLALVVARGRLVRALALVVGVLALVVFGDRGRVDRVVRDGVLALVVVVALRVVVLERVLLVIAARHAEPDRSRRVRHGVLDRARQRAGVRHPTEHGEHGGDRREHLRQLPLHRLPPLLRQPRRLRCRLGGVADRPHGRVALLGEEVGGRHHRGDVEVLGGQAGRRHRLLELLDEARDVTPLVVRRAGEHPVEGFVGRLGIHTHLTRRNVERAHRVTAPRSISRR